jgi:hypothetical protein
MEKQARRISYVLIPTMRMAAVLSDGCLSLSLLCVCVCVCVVMCVSVVCDCVLLMLFFYVRWCFSLRAAFDRAWSLLFLSLSVGDARAMARGASSLSLVSCVSSARLFLKHREKIKARYRYFPGGLHGGFF